MIGFFRRIRKKLADNNQFVKYSRYAIGEILLVVIGILIALQVNNWNEEKKEQRKIRKYAESLIQDLENDILMIDTIRYVANEINIRIDSLSAIVNKNDIDEISNLDVFCLSWMKLYRPYSWNRATLDELKNSGGLQLIRNADIAKRINTYEAFARHMDEDYKEDNLISNEAWSLMSSVVNVNYPNSVALREVIRYSAVYGSLDDIFDSPEYQVAKCDEIPLNTESMALLVNAVNQYNRLYFNIDMRIRIELPRLVADARELIDLLKQEYQ
jgi:hypothetical protein